MPRKKKFWIYALLIAIGVTGILIPVISYVQKTAKNISYEIANRSALACAVGVYTNEYERLPTENWCDIFIEERAINPQYLVSPYSGAVKGESSYAMNKNIAGMKYDELPDDVVLFFETDKGLSNGPRNASITTRRHYPIVKEYAQERPEYKKIYPKKDFLVYKDRFNQYGGPEDAAFYYQRDGKFVCHVVYVSTRMEFVTEDRIADLKWTVE